MMFKLKNLKLFLISFVLGLGIFQIINNHFTAFAQNTSMDKDKPGNNFVNRTCYIEAPLEERKPTLKELQDRLKMLDKQYKDKKIDEKTYQQSKENTLKEINNLNNKE